MRESYESPDVREAREEFRAKRARDGNNFVQMALFSPKEMGRRYTKEVRERVKNNLSHTSRVIGKSLMEAEKDKR